MTFTPAGGSPRPVSVRIGEPQLQGDAWVSIVELDGFRGAERLRVVGVDWAQAIELAARTVASECQRTGTLEPPMFPRPPE
ncbi:MAG: hypothetical protein R3F14_13495 [Polyangiaceae bacterium]